MRFQAMHETAIAGAILEKVTERLSNFSRQAEAGSVKVQVGTFRNVDPESLSFAFDSLKMLNPALTGCILNLEVIQAVALCADNEHEYAALPDNLYRCNICDSGMGRLIKGEELDITGITIIEVDQTETMTHA